MGMSFLQVSLHREETRAIHIAEPTLNFRVIESDVKVQHSEVAVGGPTDNTQPQALHSPLCRLHNIVDVLLYCRHGGKAPQKVVKTCE